MARWTDAENQWSIEQHSETILNYNTADKLTELRVYMFTLMVQTDIPAILFSDM